MIDQVLPSGSTPLRSDPTGFSIVISMALKLNVSLFYSCRPASVLQWGSGCTGHRQLLLGCRYLVQQYPCLPACSVAKISSMPDIASSAGWPSWKSSTNFVRSGFVCITFTRFAFCSFRFAFCAASFFATALGVVQRLKSSVCWARSTLVLQAWLFLLLQHRLP